MMKITDHDLIRGENRITCFTKGIVKLLSFQRGLHVGIYRPTTTSIELQKAPPDPCFEIICICDDKVAHEVSTRIFFLEDYPVGQLKGDVFVDAVMDTSGNIFVLTEKITDESVGI